MESMYDSYEKIQLQLEVLESEFDVKNLHQLSQSIMTIFQRLKMVYLQSLDLQKIDGKIRTTIKATAELLHNTRKENYWQNQFEEDLETLLDLCDAIADRLDDMDEQNVAVEDLMPAYNRLIAEVTEIQDVIDGLPRSEAQMV